MEYKRKRDAGLRANLNPDMTLIEAGAEWLRALGFAAPGEKWTPRPMGFIGQRTYRDFKAHLQPLGKHFLCKKLRDITIQDVQGYQRARADGVYTDQTKPKPGLRRGPGAGSNVINKELSFLLRLLRLSRAWTAEQLGLYIPLQPYQPDVQRALTVEEQERFMRTAASSEKWAGVYWFSMLALNTTMRTCEIRALQVGDFDIANALVKVGSEGAKNQGSIRAIPLNRDALKAAEAIIERAKRHGSYSPQHYVFSYRNRREQGRYHDPTRPMTESGIKKHWDAVRDAAGVPWFRMYDLRHTAITRLAEAGTPIQVIMEFAGHIDPRMQQRYTHISMQAKRRAAALSLLETEAKGKAKFKDRAPLEATASVDNGATGGLSLSDLIKRLQRAALPPETILAILSDADVASVG